MAHPRRRPPHRPLIDQTRRIQKLSPISMVHFTTHSQIVAPPSGESNGIMRIKRDFISSPTRLLKQEV